jgi:Lon protease-like protein
MDSTPMFPLGSVLVPSMVLPLHVFESRYRRLMGDCLERDGMFGVVLIERGSEVGGGDQRCDVGTLARIIDTAVTADGRWGVLAVGVERLRVVEWLDDNPYPQARVEPWPDEATSGSIDDLVAAAMRQLRRLWSLATEMGADGIPGDLTLSDDVDEAAWQLVALSPLGPADRQTLLATPNAHERITRLAAMLTEEFTALQTQLELGADPDDGDGGGLQLPPDW